MSLATVHSGCQIATTAQVSAVYVTSHPIILILLASINNMADRIYVRRMPLYCPLKCSACEKEIKIGEEYHAQTARETHTKCLPSDFNNHSACSL